MARPRNFDEHQALQAAMSLFWERGYDATSIDALVSVTGASRASLYQVWGDKQGLYVAALHHYGSTVRETALAALAQGEPLAAIRSYFLRATELVASGFGCMVVQATMEPGCDAAAISAVTRAQLDRVQAALGDALRRAEIADPDAHAAHLAVALQGLLVQARARPARSTLDAYVRLTLSTLPESP